MVNVDGSKRIWKQPEIKDIFEKCGAKKPDKATWGDVQSNKTPLYLIGELIGVPNTVMDSALHELRDRIDKDPKYKDVKNWLESLPKI